MATEIRSLSGNKVLTLNLVKPDVKKVVGIEVDCCTSNPPSGFSTLKEHFRSLTEKGHISLHGNGRGSWYSLT